MLEKQGNGVVLFCYNNEPLDYTRFAILAATYARKQLKLLSIITDDGTKGWMEETHSKELLDATFDKFIIDNGGVANKRNMRRHMDSPGLNLMLLL